MVGWWFVQGLCDHPFVGILFWTRYKGTTQGFEHCSCESKGLAFSQPNPNQSQMLVNLRSAHTSATRRLERSPKSQKSIVSRMLTAFSSHFSCRLRQNFEAWTPQNGMLYTFCLRSVEKKSDSADSAGWALSRLLSGHFFHLYPYGKSPCFW